MADKDKKNEVTVRTEAGHMTVSMEDDFINIKMPRERSVRDTKSGTHRQLATTHGNVTTDLEVDGEPVIVNLNIFTPKH